MPRALWMWFSLAVTALGAVPARAQVVQCQKCHGNRAVLAGEGGTAAQAARLYVPQQALAGTVHEKLRCAECHVGYERGFPHVPSSTTRSCAACHETEGRDWDQSIHAQNAKEQGDAPTCTGCHGIHQIYPASDRRSPTNALNVAALCGKCHNDARIIGTYFSTAADTQAQRAVNEYFQTVHGMALTEAGLVVSATCNDCHGAHKVLPAKSPDSRVNRAHVAETCGTCHVGVRETFDESSHGKALAAGDTTADGHQAPVCIDCHTGHQIVRADEPHWYVGVVEECGSCHEKEYETYLETYHGKVTALGSALAAQCSECHTAHAMRPASDPASSVYPMNLMKTCGQCHAEANVNFTRYYAHGDPKSRTKYPLLFWPWLAMTTLLVSVMSFFLLHTALWLIRSAVDYVRARRRGGAEGTVSHG